MPFGQIGYARVYGPCKPPFIPPPYSLIHFSSTNSRYALSSFPLNTSLLFTSTTPCGWEIHILIVVKRFLFNSLLNLLMTPFYYCRYLCCLPVHQISRGFIHIFVTIQHSCHQQFPGKDTFGTRLFGPPESAPTINHTLTVLSHTPYT